HMLERCDLRELVAVDRDPARLDTARATLARLGLTATFVQGDAAAPAGWWDGEPCDRALIDAPCRPLGGMRRPPDIKLQRAPGGGLVYATCTILRCENGEQIDGFLARTPGAVVAAEFPPEQILPGESNRDGFYYACIDKQQAPPSRVSGSKH